MRVTKTELKNIIKESVKDVLNETSRRQKAQQAIKGVSNRIKTCAILTSENPLMFLPQKYNDRLRTKLEMYLKIGNYVWFPVKGEYKGKEKSYIVYNISFDDTMYLATKFEQESFIFIDNRGDEPVYQYWQQNGNGEFYKVSERNTYIDASDANDFFTQIGRKFKFQIPFFDDNNEEELMEHYTKINSIIEDKIARGIIDENYVNTTIDRNLHSEKCSGRRLWEMRGVVYGRY